MRARLAAEPPYRALIEQMLQGAVACDDAGAIRYCNHAFCALLGAESAVLTGSPIDRHLRPSDQPVFAALLREARTIAGQAELALRAADGGIVPVRVSLMPAAHDGDGWVCLVVTRLTAAAAAAGSAAPAGFPETGRQRLELAQRAAGVGIFEWDMTSDVAQVTPEWRRMYGLASDGATLTRAEWMRALHPLDRERAAAKGLSAALSGAPYEDDVRVLLPDGSVRWIRTGGKTLFDAGRRPVRFIGTAFDITDIKSAEMALRENEARLRVALSSAALATWDWDMASDRLSWSAELAARQEISPQQAPATIAELIQLIHPQDRVRVRVQFEQCRRGAGRFECEYRMLRAGGGERWVRGMAGLMHDADGRAQRLIGVELDITATVLAAEELARAKNAAEAASAAKDQFLAVLSHELRTPLAPVRMAVSIWERRRELLPREFQDDLTIIRRNIDLECKLIDDMLDLNRIVHGKLELQFARIDLHEEIRHAVLTVADEAKAKQIRIATDFAAPRAEVVGDAGRLQQVLWNLLKNAVKFTPPQGSVAVRTGETPGGRICVTVCDSGMGIEADIIGRIFNAFEQGSRLVTHRFGGLGLGLAISKALTETHGGTLTARSDGQGRGATFTLDLPLAQVPAGGESGAGAAPSVPAPHEPTAGCRLLLVEDHEDTARIMESLLVSLGYEVCRAGSVAEAVAATGSRSFDLLISDIGLPDGSGFELVRELAAQRPIKAIALSGYGMETDVQRGRGAGFTAYLTKPINLGELEATIQRVMSA